MPSCPLSSHLLVLASPQPFVCAVYCRPILALLQSVQTSVCPFSAAEFQAKVMLDAWKRFDVKCHRTVYKLFGSTTKVCCVACESSTWIPQPVWTPWSRNGETTPLVGVCGFSLRKNLSGCMNMNRTRAGKVNFKKKRCAWKVCVHVCVTSSWPAKPPQASKQAL